MRAAYLMALIPALLPGCVEKEKEGDFTIQMPQNGPVAQSAPNGEPATLAIRLKADAHGKLSGVFLDGQQLEVAHGDVLDLLNRRVREIIQNTDGHASDSPDYEAVIHVDGPLDYSFVIDATKAVSSYADPDGTVHRLVARVRFASPDTGGSPETSFASPPVDGPSTTSQDAHHRGANYKLRARVRFEVLVAMVDFLLFLGILIPALLLGTTIAVAPAVALSFYLAPSGATARTNITVGVATALVGVFLGGLVFDPVARTPPAQAYVMVGAWVGGTLGVGIAAVVQFLTHRRGFCLQRSLKSWFIVLTLMCLGCALIKFVWSRQW